MKPIEFFNYEKEAMYRMGDQVEKLTESSTEAINFILGLFEELYPKAYKASCKEYDRFKFHQRTFRFRMARRLIRCNFGNVDEREYDVTSTGTLQMENVPCPLRGDCPLEGIICNPEFNSKISPAELPVLKLLYEGLKPEDIAQKLIKSPHTINNHIRNAYTRMGVHSYGEFCKYVDTNKLFK